MMWRVIVFCICVLHTLEYALSAPAPCEFPFPKSYILYHLSQGQIITIDGKLDEPAWQEVVWTDPFIDIQGPSMPQPRFETRAKMRWDDDYLYVGGYLQEPQIWANQTEHNSVIFYDNDFEVFIDPDGSNAFYKEFEINAINTWWNLYLNKPYMDGGSPTNDWDIVPIKTAVFVNGTVNDPRVVSHYWTVELAFPLKALVYKQTITQLPPAPGSQWRINFSRVEYHVKVVDGRFVKVPNMDEDNWVWSSQKYVNMHVPEYWGIIQFSRDAVNSTHFIPDRNWALRNVLLEVYYAERKFQTLSGYHTPDLEKLELSDYIKYGKCSSVPVIIPNETTLGDYVVTVKSLDGTAIGQITQDRIITIH